MRLTTAAGRVRPPRAGEPPGPGDPLGPGEPSGAAHQATLERAFGRILAVFLGLMVVTFWSSSATLTGQRPGGMASDLVLSVLLTWQSLLALRRPPSRRDLWLMVAATGALLVVARALAVPGSAFLDNNAEVLVMPVASAWAVWARRLVVPVPVLLIAVVSWAWGPGGGLPVEQAVGALAIVACISWAARLLRVGAGVDLHRNRIAR